MPVFAAFQEPGSLSADALEVPAPETGTSEAGEESSSLGYIRPVPAVGHRKEPPAMRPFSTVALGFTANTLGAGVEAATPLSRSFNLRAGVNFFTFGHPIQLDGIEYDARLHFRSAQMMVDWFPEHGGFHVSTGILYVKNNLSAIAGVPEGQYFELGDQGFTNSIDDPFSGTASVTYPHKVAPVLMLGFSNILPRNNKHFSMPYEFGIAYTGQPRVNVTLDGTACTYEGCFDASTNAEVKQNLQQEIDKLNKSLKSFPIYPIISLGLAYRF